MNPLVVCVSMCLCVCLYVCLYVSLCVLLCLWLAMYVYMCLCVCLYVSACFFHESVCLSVSLWVVHMSLWLFVWECICVCLPVFMYSTGSIPWAACQKERLTGPCVHASHSLESMVPSWALPGSRIYPPHQTSPHSPLACFCREKTALSERFASPPIKALIRSSWTDAKIKSQSNWEPDWGQLLANEWHRGG